MDRLDVGGQHLAGLGDVHMRMDVCARVSAHVAAVGAVSDGYEGSVSRGLVGPSRGGVCDARGVGGVVNSCRGAICRVQQTAARERQCQRGGGDCAPGQPPCHCGERVICSAQAAIVPEATHLLVYLRCSEPLITGEDAPEADANLRAHHAKLQGCTTPVLKTSQPSANLFSSFNTAKNSSSAHTLRTRRSLATCRQSLPDYKHSFEPFTKFHESLGIEELQHIT